MNDFEKVIKAIKRILDTRTSYEVSKALGVPNRTINRYQNGTTPIENMTLGTAEKIYNYYEGVIKVENETLEQAIRDFNNWSGPAILYYSRRRGYYDVEVFANDVQATQAVLSDDCFIVWSKTELEQDHIDNLHRECILDLVELVLDGWEPHQAEYQLASKYPSIFS